MFILNIILNVNKARWILNDKHFHVDFFAISSFAIIEKVSSGEKDYVFDEVFIRFFARLWSFLQD